jgi:hypothetical protein
MRLVGHVVHIGGEERIQNFGEKTNKKNITRKNPRCRSKNDIKIYLKKIGFV